MLYGDSMYILSLFFVAGINLLNRNRKILGQVAVQAMLWRTIFQVAMTKDIVFSCKIWNYNSHNF